MTPYLVWDSVAVFLQYLFVYLCRESCIYTRNTWFSLSIQNKVAVVYTKMLGKIQANVIKASRLLLQRCNQTHDESDEEEGAIRTASVHKHTFCLAGKCKFIMYLVTKLLNNIWDHLNTNYLNISDAEWMSGQVFGSYSSFFWPALNVCFCVSVCVCGLVVGSLILGICHWSWVFVTVKDMAVTVRANSCYLTRTKRQQFANGIPVILPY